MIFTASLAFGQKKMTVEQTLAQVEHELSDAMVKGDTAALIKYFDAREVITDPGGMLMNKAQAIAMFKSGDLKFESMKIDDVKVRLFGNTAIVIYRTNDKGSFKGQAFEGQSRWTDTFIKMNGKWVIVAAQGTPIMPQQQ